MQAKKKDVDGGDIAVDLYPFIRQYRGGHLERLLRSSFVAASEDAATNRGVATRDVVINKATGVSARMFLPSRAAPTSDTLPVIMYVHGGSFCTESAFGRTYNNYARSLASRTGALVVSVEYRLAPEHPVPAAYEDAWVALQWLESLSDPWLSAYADPGRTFLAGDSAGGNIVYNTAVRASRSNIDIEGLVMVHPYFWGVDRLSSSETVWDGVSMLTPKLIDSVWPYVTAGKLGVDDPWINPVDEEIASLTCRRVLVAVAEKDSLRDRGAWMVARMRDRCVWADDEEAVTLVESEGEDHGFHLYNPMRATSKILMESIVQFINQPMALPLPAALLPELHELHACQGTNKSAAETMDSAQLLCVPTRPYIDVFGYGMAMKSYSGPTNMMARSSCLQIGRGTATKATRYVSFLGHMRPNKTNWIFLSTAVEGSSVFRSFV